MKNQPKTSDIVITSKEQADKIFNDRDQGRIDEFYRRIEVANNLADEISDKLFSGVKLSLPELTLLKNEATEYKGILEQIILNPRLKIKVWQKKNREIADALDKRMEDVYNRAMKRLSSSIDVIDTRIEVRKIKISDPVEKKLSDYLSRNDEHFLELLISMLENKRGVYVAKIILALNELGYLTFNPTDRSSRKLKGFYDMMKLEFRIKGTYEIIRTSLNDYDPNLKTGSITKSDITDIAYVIKSKMQ